jgi:membrane-bound serine protease (ClpP class)
VLIDMDTYGGAVNDADLIRTKLLEYPKPTWVFINKNAASAGALISIACDSIYMTPGANIGAATVVTGDGTAAPDKYQSYMRSMMRSTAEAKGRNPKIAEAMVDQNLVVDTIVQAGQVITFTAAEAIKYGFCEGTARSIEEVLALNNIENYEIIRYEQSIAERIISIFLNPVISGILILVIVGGVYFELQTPGVGFPIMASIVAAVLYFIPYYLLGLAENWELLLFIIGLGLVAVEIFVIPGFGIFGIAGIILTFGALMMMMLDNQLFDFRFVPVDQVFEALIAVLIGIGGAFIVLVLGGFRLSQSAYMQRVSLQTTMDKSLGYSSADMNQHSLVGQTGVAYTVLRPGGKVLINDRLYDATTRGDYINRDESVIVVSEEVSTLRVKRLSVPEAKS